MCKYWVCAMPNENRESKSTALGNGCWYRQCIWVPLSQACVFGNRLIRPAKEAVTVELGQMWGYCGTHSRCLIWWIIIQILFYVI